MRRTLIVGAGLTGAVLAREIAERLDERVVVIDRREHIGGNTFDGPNGHGVVVHHYGPHIFHTNAPQVANYLSRYTDWRSYEHRVVAWFDDRWVPLPFNMTAMEIVFGETEGRRLNAVLAGEYGLGVKVPILKMRQSGSADVRRVADLVYEKVFLHYTMKQWGVAPDALDPSVSARVPVFLSRDDRYFQDTFQAMPRDGYAALVARMLDDPRIELRCGQSFEDVDGVERFDRVVFTGAIDEFFDHVHGPLPYRSIRFDMVTTESGHTIQRAAQQNFPTPAAQHAFTRSTEFRQLTGQGDIGHTTLAFEYPEDYVPGRNEPYYPIPHEDSRRIYRRYAAEAAKLGTVFFAGRLADYSYYNMDQAVARALACFEKEIAPRRPASAGREASA
ncbi:UDP-galactopyranose mutase [Prosthecomicrobium pneumaticum]|uniref:UDP-galactopyranose mutase n=1 Tax=Prosthecomicrobium pneumaticum TaxID=81895 RepID=A0A7W9CUN0_9HYPH|nr:UDP-galactopyranose mutase [Prosthecomicrobium pneumaticum]MBB5751878.1 UDP-galactopyranose mutase [Prosthecomicrobium pneumaticum]